MLKLGEVIKDLRLKKGWTQAQLATELGFTQHTVSQWENGHRIIDLNTFQKVLELLDATLSINRSNLNSAAYRLEPSDYTDSTLMIGIEPNPKACSELGLYKISLERSGLKLILPEFSFGDDVYTLEQKEEMVMSALGLDYALIEDCPTLADYLANRGITQPTQYDFNAFEQLKHDVDCSLNFFDPMELADVEY